MPGRVFLDVEPGRAVENVGEQLGLTAAVVELGTRLARHGQVDHVLDPVVARLHGHRVVARVDVREILVPVEPACHGEQVPNLQPPLPLVHVPDRGGVEELQHRRVDTGKIPPRHGGPDHDRRYGLGHRLERVQVAPAVVRVPPGIEVVVRTGEVRGVERIPGAGRVGVDSVVIMTEATVEDDPSTANQQHAIDVAVVSALDLARNAVEDLAPYPGGGRSGGGPTRW